MTRGRKSSASLETLLVDVGRKAIEPPADLQPGAASVFNQIVGSVEPSHFRKSDVHLLASLAQAIFLILTISENPKCKSNAARLSFLHGARPTTVAVR